MVDIARPTSLVVWKYPIDMVDLFSLDLPLGAQVLHVEMQKDTCCMWCLVDPDAPPKARRFRLAGTGHPIIDCEVKYIGTFNMMDSVLVFHLFEECVTEEIGE
jgi:hypothetical protein